MGSTALLLAAVAGGGASAGLGIASAVGQRRQAEAQAKQAEINAEQVRASNRIEAQREARRSRARVGALEAKVGASGVTRSGTALSLISDEIVQGKLNEAIVLARGSQELARQQNIRTSIKSSARGQLIGSSIGSVAHGIAFGSQLVGLGGGLGGGSIAPKIPTNSILEIT